MGRITEIRENIRKGIPSTTEVHSQQLCTSLETIANTDLIYDPKYDMFFGNVEVFCKANNDRYKAVGYFNEFDLVKYGLRIVKSK